MGINKKFLCSKIINFLKQTAFAARKIALSTAGLITISVILTVSIVLSCVYVALQHKKSIFVSYSYYLSDYIPTIAEPSEPPSTELILDAVASNNAISVALASGTKRLKNIPFSVTIRPGKITDGTKSEGTAYRDSNSDGIITVANLKAGVYTIYPNTISEPYKVSKAVEVTVVAYKPKKDILNQVISKPQNNEDTIFNKNETVEKENLDKTDDTSSINREYTIPEYDSSGNIVYRIDSIKDNYLNDISGAEYVKNHTTSSIYIKQADGSSKEISGYVIKKKAVDPERPKIKAVTQFLVVVQNISNGTETTNYFLYNVSAYTKKSKFTIKTGWNIIDGKRYYYSPESKFLTGWQYISGHRYHFSKSGVMDSIKGIDVSVYQKDIDWQKVADSGIKYAIIRAAYRGYETGKLVLDDKFYQNIKGALAAGIEVGVYIFSQAVNAEEAVEEASLLLELTKGYKVTFPLVIDIEAANSAHTGRADKISREQRTEVIKAFCETVKNGGKTPMLYTGMWYYKSMMDSSQLKNYPLWIAYYADKEKRTESPSVKDYSIWQYSSSGKVAGISTRTDMNAMIKRKW